MSEPAWFSANGRANERANAAAHELFMRTMGRPPESVWSAPGRVNLIGEHTDYNDGFVLPFAIEQRTFAAVAPRTDGEIRVVSTFATFNEAPVQVPIAGLTAVLARGSRKIADWARYPLGVAWALLQQADVDASRLVGIDLAFASDVPVGAGLSSSAALECATAAALNAVWGLGEDRATLAGACQLAENEAVGAPTGIMDQMAAMFGQQDAAVFLDCRSLLVQTVPLQFAADKLALLVIDTKTRHSHATGGYADRRAACKRGAKQMGVASLRELTLDDLARCRQVLGDTDFRRVRHVVTENQRVLHTVAVLQAAGPRAIGGLLNASHASMRDDFGISTNELDLAVDAANRAGALGARMTGGGFGGAAIALIEREARAEVTAKVRQEFAQAGLADPDVFEVRPSAGAEI